MYCILTSFGYKGYVEKKNVLKIKNEVKNKSIINKKYNTENVRQDEEINIYEEINKYEEINICKEINKNRAINRNEEIKYNEEKNKNKAINKNEDINKSKNIKSDSNCNNYFVELSQDKYMVTIRGILDVLSIPIVQGECLITLYRGSIIQVIPGECGVLGWIKVRLLDGNEGFVREIDLAEIKAGYNVEREQFKHYFKRMLFENYWGYEKLWRMRILETAKSYLGTQYRWGGKTPLGIDCSGLAFMTYWLNGVTIWRDAKIKEGYPIMNRSMKELKIGDLLYFPGHIAIYIGKYEYIHSTGNTSQGGVVINSLNPNAPNFRKDLKESLYAVGGIREKKSGIGVVDLHCDTLSKINDLNSDFYHSNFHIDINKLKKGNYLMQCFAVFVDTKSTLNPIVKALNQIEMFHSISNKYKEYLEPVYKFQDIEQNKNRGLISALLSIEDAALIGDDLEMLEVFYKLGVRMITLTWNYENQWGFPNVVVKKEEEIFRQRANKFIGLKPKGYDLIKKMQELGIVIDVSHLSDKGFWDVYNNTTKPFVASHSNARSMCNHVRNLTDEMIIAIAKKDGVIGVNYNNDFLLNNGFKGNRISTVKAIANQIDYIIKIGGNEVVALGSDFDGISCELEMKDASNIGMLEGELRNRNYTNDQIENIFYKNALRVFKQCL